MLGCGSCGLSHYAAVEGLRMDLRIRDATEADLPAIVDIYNQSIPAGWSTADTQPITVTDRVEWFRKYDPAAEVSVYLATAFHRRGIGRQFKQWVIEQCPRLGVTTLLSMHFDHNEATRRINESLGFQRLGHLTEIAMVQGHKRG